jgi:hypothetical protein
MPNDFTMSLIFLQKCTLSMPPAVCNSVEKHDTLVNDTHAQDKCPTYIYQMIELSTAI